MAGTPQSAGQIIRNHWPEYLMEAWGLGMFMISAGVVVIMFEYPGSPIHHLIPNGDLRRVLTGIAMGLTAIAIIYSPWGKRSGAHINPAVTLTMYRLGKVRRIDALCYMVSQVMGGTLGILLVWSVFGSRFALPPVDFVNTRPGPLGIGVAFGAEVAMSFAMMLMVLVTIANTRLIKFTGVFAGILVSLCIALFGPLSGFSINPARTLASALPSGLWQFLWLYFTAPVMGMLLAVEVVRTFRLAHGWFCAKLNHDLHYRCIHCGYEPVREAPVVQQLHKA